MIPGWKHAHKQTHTHTRTQLASTVHGQHMGNTKYKRHSYQTVLCVCVAACASPALPSVESRPQAAQTRRHGPTAPVLRSTALGEMKIPEPIIVPTMRHTPLSRLTWGVVGREGIDVIKCLPLGTLCDFPTTYLPSQCQTELHSVHSLFLSPPHCLPRLGFHTHTRRTHTRTHTHTHTHKSP